MFHDLYFKYRKQGKDDASRVTFVRILIHWQWSHSLIVIRSKGPSVILCYDARRPSISPVLTKPGPLFALYVNQRHAVLLVMFRWLFLIMKHTLVWYAAFLIDRELYIKRKFVLVLKLSHFRKLLKVIVHPPRTLALYSF